MDFVKVAVMGLDEAKNLQTQLREENVEIMLNHSDKTCTRGCSVTVEVHAKESDIPKVSEIYQKTYMKLLEGHDVNLEVMGSVYDPEKESATCPACGAGFSTSSSECPECGLVLG